ncbi:C-C motif chemokine 4 homolog [Clarias gariepinus]|uniref:C-C motif chemokine 4 homolog n=1 Tax=Clarias gariepinus TaxID=13013 RepID=UPI00234D2F56|nr:C-C motif chemokine 4 homolog [Clarias gariepinus]
MSSRSLLLVLVILVCLQCFTMSNNGHGPEKCCFDYLKNPNPKQNIISYTKTEHQCPKPGVIFILKKGYQVCADPRVEWVKERMKKIDQLKVKNKTRPKTTV